MDLLASAHHHLASPALVRPLCLAVGGGALLYGLAKLYGAHRLRKLRLGLGMQGA